MINEVILTLTDSNGNSAILDLYENEKMHLNYKFTDITDFASVGNYSQEFRVPASKTNTDFFGAIFNVNFDGLPRTMAAFEACMKLDAFQRAQPSACPDAE